MNKISKDNTITPEGNEIWKYACSQLGIDASPKDAAPDELGCAESVSTILNHLFPDVPVLISTGGLYTFLKASSHFVLVGTPEAGDIIISPTGFGGYNGINNGHTGILDNNGVIMSNNSATGKFLRNYTIESWVARYKVKGGYPVIYFRRFS